MVDVLPTLPPVPDSVRETNFELFRWLNEVRSSFNGEGGLTAVAIGKILNSQLAPMAAQTVKAAPNAATPTTQPQDLSASNILDFISTQNLAVLVRYNGGWEVVPPPVIDGQQLTYDATAGILKWA